MKQSRLRVALLVLGLLLVVVTTASVLLIGSRPGFCSGCHQDLAAATSGTAHSSVADCYSCHLDGAWDLPRQKLSEVFRMYPLGLIGRGPTGPSRQTSRRTCLECHQEIATAVSTGDYVRIDHASCAQEASCDGCHVSAAHGSAVRWSTGPVMEECVECHEADKASTECDVCHLADRTARLNSRGPWQVVHGEASEKTHGMGDLSSCEACHAPSTYDMPGFCAGCHGVDVPHPSDFGRAHGELAKANPDSCGTCHDTEEFCYACHQTEMPHPAEFTPQHPTVATGDQDARCLRCHVSTDCTQCHLNHVHPGGSLGVPVPWSSTNEDRRPTTR